MPENPMHVDAVVHPKHYNSLGAKCRDCGTFIECIDVVRHLSFNLGNAIKYLWRAKHKGEHIQDLWKAMYYVIDEVELRLGRDLTLLRDAMIKERDTTKEQPKLEEPELVKV